MRSVVSVSSRKDSVNNYIKRYYVVFFWMIDKKSCLVVMLGRDALQLPKSYGRKGQRLK